MLRYGMAKTLEYDVMNSYSCSNSSMVLMFTRRYYIKLYVEFIQLANST